MTLLKICFITSNFFLFSFLTYAQSNYPYKLALDEYIEVSFPAAYTESEKENSLLYYAKNKSFQYIVQTVYLEKELHFQRGELFDKPYDKYKPFLMGMMQESKGRIKKISPVQLKNNYMGIDVCYQILKSKHKVFCHVRLLEIDNVIYVFRVLPVKRKQASLRQQNKKAKRFWEQIKIK